MMAAKLAAERKSLTDDKLQTTYIPPGPYDDLTESDLRKIERSLPPTPREALLANLMWMVEHEYDDPDYYGPRILALSLKLGV